MRHGSARSMAICGVTAALAVVIICLGGLIPVATYVCPMMCAVLLNEVLGLCGSRMAWAWYGVVAILSLLLGPDKEGAGVFLFLGYYPIVKPKLDAIHLGLLWKLVLFNTATCALYAALIFLVGMGEIISEFQELGVVMLVVLLLLGNVTFFLLDKLLSRRWRKK